MAEPATRQRSLRWCAVAAAIWALAFGGLNVAWALGSELGTDKLSPTLVARFDQRAAGDVAVLLLTALIKFGGVVVALVLISPRSRPTVASWARWLAMIGGALSALYGFGDIVGGWWRWSQGTGENAIWYALLWGPIWLVGGVLFIALWFLAPRRTS